MGLLYMGCARGLGLGEQHVQDKSLLKWCYILRSGVARFEGIQFNIILKNFEYLKKLIWNLHKNLKSFSNIIVKFKTF